MIYGFKQSQSFGCSIIQGKVILLTLTNQGVPICIIFKMIFLKRFAHSKWTQESFEHNINIWTYTCHFITFENLLGIEIWHSFTTYEPCKNVLMSINESINTCITKLSDQNINFFDVGLVILAWGYLNCFPHHTKPNDIKTPVLQI